MTANEKREAVVKAYSPMIGRNNYSQDTTKREYAISPYIDGKYYSDCSSSIRWAYRAAGIGINNIGGNTAAIHLNPQGLKIKVATSNGVPTDESQLRKGDCLMFRGNDPSRPLQIGHIEMYIGNNQLFGHGSGKASLKTMTDYCTYRYRQLAPNNKRKELVEVIRFIEDDDDWLNEQYTISASNELLTVVNTNVNIRETPLNGKIIDQVTSGDKVNVDRKVFVTLGDGTRQPWFRTDRKGGWVCANFLSGWVKEENGKWWYLEKNYGYPVNTTNKEINGKIYAFDGQGWMLDANAFNADGSLK